MALAWVNERVLSGKKYVALRDTVDPKVQFIECEGVQKSVRIKDYWLDDVKLQSLFEGAR